LGLFNPSSWNLGGLRSQVQILVSQKKEEDEGEGEKKEEVEESQTEYLENINILV
jgi:hypothetical protein